MNTLIKPLLVSLVLTSCIQETKVDLIIHNAKIYSVDDMFTIYEAIAIDSGRIKAVGAEHEILNAYASDQMVDASQRPIYPGFIDAHSHFLGYGIQKDRLNLVGTKSFEEVLDRIAGYQKDRNSEWVIGRGWDQNDWEVKEFPTNDTLSKIFPDLKIVIKRIDGHAILASQNVLELAHVTSDSFISGGSIETKNGKVTGVLIDEAMSLIDAVIPELTNKEKTAALLSAERDCIGVGLTTVTDAGLSVDEVELLESLYHQSRLKIRTYAMYSADPTLLSDLSIYSKRTDRLNATSIKVYADGALGSRGAALIAPYHDDTNNIGFIITPQDSIHKWAESCKNSNFQLNVHCIGDRANRLTLNAMGDVLEGVNDRRWRIEHAQVVHKEDIELFGKFSVIPSMQPTHATSDMYWAKERIGDERIETAYALDLMRRQNGLVALGTDFPVEGISPIQTFYSAVVRKDREGYPEEGFNMQTALSREDALRGITIWAAIASFEEQNRGSIEIGKYADLVMLDRDLMTCKEDDLHNANVLNTWINGEVVFEK